MQRAAELATAAAMHLGWHLQPLSARVRELLRSQSCLFEPWPAHFWSLLDICWKASNREVGGANKPPSSSLTYEFWMTVQVVVGNMGYCGSSTPLRVYPSSSFLVLAFVSSSSFFERMRKVEFKGTVLGGLIEWEKWNSTAQRCVLDGALVRTNCLKKREHTQHKLVSTRTTGIEVNSGVPVQDSPAWGCLLRPTAVDGSA